MSFVDTLRTMPTPSPIEKEHVRSAPVWRLPLIALLLLIGIAWNIFLAVTAPPFDHHIISFVTLWFGSFVPYIAACLVVWCTPASTGRQRWIELACILFGALILRVIFVPVMPNLSHDSWRYLWDARVTLHGFSPYVYAPGDPILRSLRNVLFDNSRFRDVPTLYPPGGEAIYLVSYILAPDNMVVFKSILVVFEMGTCVAVAYLLRANGMDMSRCILYAWCPLPILEFAMQGHQEAIAVGFTALAFVTMLRKGRGSSVLTGLCIALAALTNIYPLVLLIVVVYRRTWRWLLSCVSTCIAVIILAYVPYIILGHGLSLGFFGTYASESSTNPGPLVLMAHWLGGQLHLAAKSVLLLGYVVDLLVVGVVALIVLWLRWRGKIRAEDGYLLLVGAVFSASTHIFPWYTTAFLPWVIFMLAPIWTRTYGWNPRGLAAFAICYFVFFSSLQDVQLKWNYYYLLVYDVTLLLLFVAALIAWWQWRRRMRIEGAQKIYDFVENVKA